MGISGELIPVVNVEEAVTRISASWHRATQSIIDTALLIYDYSFSDEWEEIKEKLTEHKIMSKTVISMLTTIAANPTLTDPQNIHLLPASYNTLYQLHQINKFLPQAIELGLVTPHLTHKEVLEIREKIKNGSDILSIKENTKTGQTAFVTIKINNYALEDDVENLVASLLDIQSRFPFISLEYKRR